MQILMKTLTKNNFKTAKIYDQCQSTELLVLSDYGKTLLCKNKQVFPHLLCGYSFVFQSCIHGDCVSPFTFIPTFFRPPHKRSCKWQRKSVRLPPVNSTQDSIKKKV